MDCQMFSTGLSSGDFYSGGRIVMLSGTMSLGVVSLPKIRTRMIQPQSNRCSHGKILLASHRIRSRSDGESQ
jgi:hypothetical protein